jgi:hypothetical protein
MKPHASVLAVAGAIALAAVAGLTVACSQSSVTEPPEPISASPLTAPSNQPSPKPSPASTPKTTIQKQTTEPANQTTTANQTGAASRTVEACVVKMAVVNDPEPPLNVRSAPTTEGDNVVGQLKNGTLVTIAADQNGWLQIKTPLKGWVSKQQTTNSCNEKVERISLSAASDAVQVDDRFVGTGSHRYIFPVEQGQTLTINRDRGPFPMITAPDGTVLLGHEKDDRRSTWSGQLTQTGDYAIELESNFKGYRYAFSMKVE